MATATAHKTTLRQHLNGVAFLAGAVLLVASALGFLVIAPLLLLIDAVRLWQREALELFLPRNGIILFASALAWLTAIGASVLLSRADKLNRAFDRSFRLDIGKGSGPFPGGRATALEIAALVLRETAALSSAFGYSDVIEEDYGAGFWATAGEESFWVAISAVGEDIEQPQSRFVVNAAFEPGLSLLRRLRHRPDEKLFKELTRAVGAAVKTLRPPRRGDA